MSFIPVLLWLIPALFGVSVLLWLKLFAEKLTILAIGSLLGLVVAISLIYLLTILGLSIVTAVVVALPVLVFITIGLLFRSANWTHWQTAALDGTALVILLVALALFSIIAPKLLITQSDGLYVGILNAYGDVAWHVATITSFVHGQAFPPTDPIFAGTKLFYPFLINFFSAVLITTGATLATSVVAPVLVLCPLLFLLLYIYVRDLTGTKTAGVIAVLLFMCAGATVGWLHFNSDWQQSGQSLPQFLLHLPSRDFTGHSTDSTGLHFLNPITSLLLPQRSFLFGIPLALAIVILLFHATTSKSQRLLFVIAGVMAGLLPLFHVHTVLALIPVISALLILKPTKQWLAFIGPAVVLGLPEVLLYISGHQVGQSFFRWGPGWTVGDMNLGLFWLKNTGWLIPAVIVGLFLPAPRQLKSLAIAAAAIFIVANLWLFAPWAWDNFKLLIFWFIFSLPLIAWMVTKAWQTRRLVFIAPVAGVLIFQMLSGALDLWKISLPTAPVWREWDANDIAMAQKITALTTPNDVIVTAPIHNSLVGLSGRTLYLGYPGHVWSHGGTPWAREAALKSFYEGDPAPLPEYTPQYVVVGPAERGMYPNLTINPAWRVVTQVGDITLYKLPASSPS